MCLSSPEMTPKCGKNVKINLKTPKKTKIKHCLFCHILQRRGSTPVSIAFFTELVRCVIINIFFNNNTSRDPIFMSRDPVFKCEGTSIPLVEEVELLGVTVDNKLKSECQIKKICRN